MHHNDAVRALKKLSDLNEVNDEAKDAIDSLKEIPETWKDHATGWNPMEIHAVKDRDELEGYLLQGYTTVEFSNRRIKEE